jgi:hypothetical protein
VLKFYHSSLDIVEARVKAQMGANMSGGYWPETTTIFGLYDPTDWGCDTFNDHCPNKAKPELAGQCGPPKNGYTR